MKLPARAGGFLITMKTSLLALLAALVLTPSLQAKPGADAGKGRCAERRALLKDLDLTAEQKAKLKAHAKKKWADLSPEQQAKLRERAIERIGKLSPEKKAEMKARIEARLKDLSAEERAAFLEKHPVAAELLK